MAEVQTPASVSTTKDAALGILAVIAILGGIVAFYWYDELPLVARVGMVAAGVAAGAGLAWLSSYGHEFLQFFQLARVELRKVVWPGRGGDDPDHGRSFHLRRSHGRVFFRTRLGSYLDDPLFGRPV